MKKICMILFSIFLGLFFVTNVSAAELPREGVTYFMEYPGGLEVVTEDYDEAVSNPETVIYEGTTDQNGQIVLNEIGNVGEIRVVESAPDGYATSEKEYVIDLGTTRNVAITNKSLTNPKTSQYFPIIIALLIIVSLLYLGFKKNKKVLMIIPVALMVFFASHANAAVKDFVITVQDDSGNVLAGVAVKVYAKPIRVQGLPAFKVSANGGHFFDGETLMYVKIPYDGCTWGEMWNYLYDLDEYKAGYMDDNVFYAYRDGYSPYWPEDDNSLYNGYVYSLGWEQDDEAKIITYHGNGGMLNFYGHLLENYTLYVNRFFDDVGKFTNGNLLWNGFSDQASCENHWYGGLPEEELSDVYVCWSEKPDGMYFDDQIVLTGNPDSCSVPVLAGLTGYYTFGVDNNSSNHYDTFRLNINSNYTDFEWFFNDENSLQTADDPWSKIELIRDGESILILSKKDFDIVPYSGNGYEYNDYVYNHSSYRFRNNSKKNQFISYYQDYFQNDCVSEIKR